MNFINFVACLSFCYIFFAAWLVDSQMTLPSMVTIPPDSPPATLNTSNTYVMNIYDQACLDSAEPSSSSNQSSSSNSTSSSDSDDDDQLSQWVQSQFIVYVGAVALNSNNTCQVVCQVQSLKQFSIMFGPDIRTRSVLVGRVYISSMPDGTSCTAESSNGTCSSGTCGSGGSNETTTESSVSGGPTELTTLASNETTSEGNTTVSGETVATTLAGGSTTLATTNATTLAPSG